MYCVRKVLPDLWWVGASDRRLSMFEGIYAVKGGVSYNSYLLMDEKTVLLDTVDKAVSRVFFENVEHVLGGRTLDYIVVQHMEPDHTAALVELLAKYPEAKLVCNAMTAGMIRRFFALDVTDRALLVKENDTLETGSHTLRFMMAPMVHWPEVMVTFDSTSGTLFSADAFGCFGALNGALFMDELDFEHYLPEYRRYYTNIVGKYGAPVQALLKKAAALDVKTICPLHGFVWRNNLGVIIGKHDLWSRYIPEEKAVMIAYASIYGNTENAADCLAVALRERGVKTVVYDVSVTPSDELISEAFRYESLVFASSTYNTAVFPAMDSLLRELAAHNLQNRRLAFIENGSWAPAAGKGMAELIAKRAGMEVVSPTLTLNSALRADQAAAIEAMADALAGLN